MVALVRASDIAYRDFHANIRRLQIDRGCSRERFQGAAACNPLPFLFSEVRIGSSIFADKLLDGINDGVRVFPRRDNDIQLIPKPSRGCAPSQVAADRRVRLWFLPVGGSVAVAAEL